MARYLKNGDNIELKGIDGHYVIKGVIGRGSSCVVYSAEFVNPHGEKTEHLLKEFNPRCIELIRENDYLKPVKDESLAKFNELCERFTTGFSKQNELRSIPSLKNYTANIQNIYHDHGTVYVDMTTTKGELYEGVEEKSIYNLATRIKVLARVIGEYHKHGYLHLDIKPQNFFARPEDETCEDVLLFDFDSLVPFEDVNGKCILNNEIQVSYTTEYAPIELLDSSRREKICRATDIYEIGEIFFEKLMDRHSTAFEHSGISKFEYNVSAPIFENVNPKVYPLLDEFFRNTLCNNVKSRYQTVDELVAKLDEIIAISNPKEQLLITTCPPAKQCFVGRNKELNEIHDLLNIHKVLFVSGLGGIGKSELAKKYASMHMDDYDEIIFASYAGSIMLLINDDMSVRISNFSCPDNTSQSEYYKSKFRKLSELCTERTLFIIDNLNTLEFSEDDKLRWTELLKLRCKFLFTTRMQKLSFATMQISEIASHEDKLKLFNKWCEIEDDEQMKAASRIIELVGGHTFTIELIAKQTYCGFSSPVEKLDTLLKAGIVKSGGEIVEADKDLVMSEGRVIDHICMLFDVAKLDDAKQVVLNNLVLIPPSGLDANLFANICAWGDDLFETEEHCVEVLLDDGTILSPRQVKSELIWLATNGWITRNQQRVCVHPVIAEAVLAKMDSLVHISPIISGVPNCASEWEKYPSSIKVQLIGCAQNMLSFLSRQAESSEAIVSALNMLGLFYCKKQYMMSEALLAFQLAEKKIKEGLLHNIELEIVTKNGIAVVHDCMADISGESEHRHTAISMLKECISMYDMFDADMINVASTWQNLACAYDNLGMHDLAEQAFEKAVEILKEDRRRHGDTVRRISELTTTYINYAIHYKKIKSYDEALLNLNTAWGYASLLGDKTEKIAKICHDIAAIILLMEGGDMDRALNCAKWSLKIRSEILLSDSYYLAMSKYVLARCYIRMGLDENILHARQLLLEAKPVYVKALGETHHDVEQLSNMLEKLTVK